MAEQQRGRGRGRGGGGRGGRGDAQQSLPFRSGNQGDGYYRGGRGGRGSPSNYRGDDGGRAGSSGYRGDGGGRDGGRGGGGGGGPPTVFNPAYRPLADQAVAQKEDKLLASSKADSSIVLPRRPAYGAQGQKILLWANYFSLGTKKDVGLHRYDVQVSVPGSARTLPVAITKRIIVLLIEDHLQPHRIDAVSDLRGTLVSRQSIADNLLSVNVTYRAELEPIPEDDAPVYLVKLTHSGTLTLDSLLDYTTATNASAALRNNQELIQALNLVVGYGPKTSPAAYSVARNMHASSAPTAPSSDLTGGLQALRAFVFSVRAATERLLVNVQIKPLPFYEAGPLTAVVAHLGRVTPIQIHKFLRRVGVQVTHIQRRSKSGNIIPRYKTLDGLASMNDGRGLAHPPRVAKDGAGPRGVEFWIDANPGQLTDASQPPAEQGKGKGKKAKGRGPQPGSSNMAEGGRYITVYDFFRTRYPAVQMDDKRPVVNAGTAADPSYLPMEVCKIRPGQLARDKVDAEQTKSMIRFAVRRPALNAESISVDGLNLLGLQGANQFTTAFGITVNPQLITVPGRVLPAPTIGYGGSGSQTPQGASWNIASTKLLRATHLANWAILQIMDSYSEGCSTTSIEQFKQKLKSSGMTMSPPRTPGSLELKGGWSIETIREKIAGIDQELKGQLSMLVVIMPQSTDIYNMVKYICDVELGILCQCAVTTKFNKSRNDQYFANVALKMNLKLGGVNHKIQKTQFGNVSLKNTMFVGIDVTHPSPGSAETAPSVAGMVSSMDEFLGQWPAALRVQTARQEMVDALDDMLQAHLRLWRKKNERLPSSIIVYRDGVSEGQYQLVLDRELPALQKAINTIYSPADKKQYAPRLSIIVVGKRHHTRFYPTSTSSMNDKTGNPLNGTVVDRGVTEVGNWDFFLQAHNALQGTAKPAHYYVIYDEVLRGTGPNRQTPSNAADHLEEMTHHLCYLFGRATKAVSICPPAYYADLVCERARCYLASHFAPASGGQNTAATLNAMQQAVTIHPKVREKMFYI